MMIDKQTQDILLNTVIVGDHFEMVIVGTGAGLAHVFGPRRCSQFDGTTLLPLVGLAAGHTAGELLAGHQRQLLRFIDQLIGGGAIGGNNAAQGAEFTDVQNERTGIDVPNNRNLVAIEVELRGFRGAPVRRNLGKLANDQRFDIWTRGFLVVEIGADIPDVGIGEADNLSRVTGIGENFLVTGKAGIENNFSAAAGDGAGCAAVKYAPVFEREYGGSVLNFRQCVLRTASFIVGLGRRQGPEVIYGPVGKHRAAVDVLACNRAENAGIVRADAMIAHHKITSAGNFDRAIVADVGVLWRDVRLGDGLAIDVDNAAANFDALAGEANDAFDERLGAIQGIPEHDDVAANDGLETIHKLVDEDALLIGKERGHAGALDFNRLIEEHDDDQGEPDSNKQVASPNTNFVTEDLMRS